MKALLLFVAALFLTGRATENNLRSEQEQAMYKKNREHHENKMMDALIFDGVPMYSSGAMD